MLLGDPKLVDGLTAEQILPLLTHPKFPKSYRELAFGCRELLARIPADDVFKLLCEPPESLPTALKEKALANTEIFKWIDVHNVVRMLKNRGLPAACALTIAAAFSRALPVEDVVAFLALPTVKDLEIKRTR